MCRGVAVHKTVDPALSALTVVQQLKHVANWVACLFAAYGTQGADAASFMVRAADAAKLVKMRSKFAAQPMEADVEVLLMLEEAFD